MKNTIIGLVIAAVVLAGGYFIWQAISKPAVQMQNTSQNSESQNAAVENNSNGTGLQVTVESPANYQVLYTDSGYTPSTLTIKEGDIVTFKNQSSSGMWTASAQHPSHTAYSGTNVQQHCPDTTNAAFDECKADTPGTSWSFTFTKKGTWGYHNHVRASHFGKIVVE